MYKILAIVLLSLIVLQPTNADQIDSKINKIIQAYDSGSSLLLIVNNKNKEDKQSEAYADWSAYLNDFSKSAQDRFIIEIILPQELKALYKDSTKFTEQYTTIFMNKKLGNFYYPGPVLEPGVYIYIDTLYQQKAISEELALYRPEPVTIQFKLYRAK